MYWRNFLVLSKNEIKFFLWVNLKYVVDILFFILYIYVVNVK